MLGTMRRQKGKSKMITPRAYAEKHEVAYTTVMFWLKNEKIAGAEKTPLPFGEGRFVYQIPEDAPKPELKPGPAPKKGR
jgi:hypothetical protein